MQITDDLFRYMLRQTDFGDFTADDVQQAAELMLRYEPKHEQSLKGLAIKFMRGVRANRLRKEQTQRKHTASAYVRGNDGEWLNRLENKPDEALAPEEQLYLEQLVSSATRKRRGRMRRNSEGRGGYYGQGWRFDGAIAKHDSSDPMADWSWKPNREFIERTEPAKASAKTWADFMGPDEPEQLANAA